MLWSIAPDTRGTKREGRTVKFIITNRWSGEAQFECELAASYETKSHSIQLAGTLQAPIAAQMFMESDERALEWLRERAYAEAQP